MNTKKAQQQPFNYFRVDLKNPLRSGKTGSATARDSVSSASS